MVYTFVQLSRQHRYNIVQARNQDIEKCRIIMKRKEDMTGRKSMHKEHDINGQEKTKKR